MKIGKGFVLPLDDTPGKPEDLCPSIRNKTQIPLDIGRESPVSAHVISFNGLADGREHLAVQLGDPDVDVPLVRLHSECLTGEVLRSLRCDCGPQLREALNKIHADGGYLLYLRQEGRGIGLYNKLDAYSIQDAGYDTYTANRMLGRGADERDYKSAAQMLGALGITQADLLTNNPDKVQQLVSQGVHLRRRLSTDVHANPRNLRYLEAKVTQTQHTIDLEGSVL